MLYVALKIEVLMHPNISPKESRLILALFISLPISIFLIRFFSSFEMKLLFALLSVLIFLAIAYVEFKMVLRGDELYKKIKLKVFAYTYMLFTFFICSLSILQFALHIYSNPLNALITATLSFGIIQFIVNIFVKKKYS